MSFLSSRLLYIVTACALVSSLSTSCRERDSVASGEREETVSRQEAEVLGNRLEGLQGNVFLSQKNSPIHWHPYTPEVLDLSEKSGRLIFAMVVRSGDPTYLEVLENLAGSKERVRELNENYVPVLIDGDVMREWKIFSAYLCGEIGSPAQLPLMIWLSSDGNPVAWLPVGDQSEEAVAKMVMHSNEMLRSMWESDEGYINQNSARDMEIRRGRLREHWAKLGESQNPAQDGASALRQLISLYDPLSRSLDHSGNAFPSNSLKLLASGARTESLPDHLRKGAKEVLGAMLADLLRSPMFDPIDGGAYPARAGRSWSMPVFHRDCVSQALIVDALIDGYEASGDEIALARALGVLKYIENHYLTEDGVFLFSRSGRFDEIDWLWDYGKLSDVLTESEKAVWVSATGMKPEGNLSMEADPSREYGSLNSIGFFRDLAEVSKETGWEQEEVSELFESAREKLDQVRQGRESFSEVSSSAHAESTLRVVSAYASAYRVTGEQVFLDRAVETLAAARRIFFDGVQLGAYPHGEEIRGFEAGRALHYGIALNSILDVYSITKDESLLIWADDLSTISAEKFTGDFLRECDPRHSLQNVEIFDASLLDDSCSLGEFSIAEARLTALDRPVLPYFAEKCRVLPAEATRWPTTYPGSVAAAILREWGE